MTLFEHETESIIAAAQQRTIANAPAVSVKDLLAADIPHPLKTYFRAHAQSLLEEELDRFRSTTRFNLDHPEVQSLQSQINSVLVMQYAFERQEFLQQLDDAVHLIINYLVRPQWTLKNFIFTKNESVSSVTLPRMLRYFGAYEYLRDLICLYLRQKHVQSLTDHEFTKVVWKLDGEYIRRRTGDDLAGLLTPVYDFLSYPLKSDSTALPVKGFVKYFEDKGFRVVAQRMNDLENQGTRELDKSGLSTFLQGMRGSSDSFAMQQTWANEAPAGDVGNEGLRSPALEQPSLAQAKQEQLPPVESLIEDGDRKRFVKRIFRQSENAFLEAVRTLDNLPTWKQASVVIDEIFIRYGVDPYSNDAKRFLEAVRQRYHSNR